MIWATAIGCMIFGWIMGLVTAWWMITKDLPPNHFDGTA